MTLLQRLCLVACVVVFGLIILGGVVRATDSGLGCPDWPRCHGSFIPRWEKHTLIEYSHRLTASIAGLLVIAIVITAWRSYRRVPAIIYPALGVLGLILFQGALGGAAVVNELPPEVIAVHLGTALTILSILFLLLATSYAVTRPLAPVAVGADFRRVAVIATALTLALMIVGSYISGAGYGLACSGWPLCNNDVFPRTEATSVQLVFLHRFLALALGVSLVALVALAWRAKQGSRFVRHGAAFALVVFCLQALVGAANIWTELASEVSAAHLALGTLLWAVLATIDIRVFRLYELLPHASTDRSNLAGVTR